MNKNITCTIRPFQETAADYARLVEVLNAMWPDVSTSAEAMIHGDQARDRNYFYQRVMVDADGQSAATGMAGETPWSYQPGKYRMEIDVHPNWRERGIGTALYDHLMGIINKREPVPTLLESGSRTDSTQGLSFLEKHGFREVMRWPTSQIDPATFDKEPFNNVIERALASGIEIHTLSELQQTDPNWQRKIYDLDWEGTLDEPSPSAPTQMPIAQFIKTYFGSPEFLPGGWFIAVDKAAAGDRYVGMSQLEKNLVDETQLNTGFTCVSRTHRRQGIAMALKVYALEFAREYGARMIRTGNEEHNPMYQINLKLGFEPQPAWLAFEKQL